MAPGSGHARGVENYARPSAGRQPGGPQRRRPYDLPADALIVVEESHQTVPQVRGMFAGDRSRKEVLVAYGFRLPSALDNRPLRFDEWEKKLGGRIYVSATPGDYEITMSGGEVVEQVIRPTGPLDPMARVEPARRQVPAAREGGQTRDAQRARGRARP